MDFTKAIELNPNDAVACYNRGYAKYAEHDLDGAIADFTKAIELSPATPRYYNSRGVAERAKGDLDDANADFSDINN